MSIDKTRAVVKDLHSRILVAIQRIDMVSKNIEDLRDKELQPQLEELIGRYIYPFSLDRTTIRVFLPTGLTKPPPSGSGKPDRFDRLPEKNGQIQISNQKRQFNRFPPVSRPVYRSGLSGNRSNSNFFLFWFKFKCPQSILTECLYNMF